MNREDAKEILSLYRPGTADAEDADVAVALSIARQDVELSRWLERHCANYETVRKQFKQIAVPVGLKEQILAERKTDNIIRKDFRRWKIPSYLAIAAAFAILLGIAAFWFRPTHKNELATYRNRMVSTALRSYAMDLETQDLTQIRAFLAQQKAPADYALPLQLEKMEATGCVVLRWQNRPISMICFRTGRQLRAGEKSDLFLFVADQTAISKSSAQTAPTLEQVNRLMTASWTEGNKLFLLAGGDEELLRKLL